MCMYIYVHMYTCIHMSGWRGYVPRTHQIDLVVHDFQTLARANISRHLNSRHPPPRPSTQQRQHTKVQLEDQLQLHIYVYV